MPTVLRAGPYQFFFYAGDEDEPAHVHVRRDRSEAKFWIDPVSLVWSTGFADHESGRIEKIIIEYRQQLIEAWNDYFKS